MSRLLAEQPRSDATTSFLRVVPVATVACQRPPFCLKLLHKPQIHRGADDKQAGGESVLTELYLNLSIAAVKHAAVKHAAVKHAAVKRPKL